MKPLFESAEWDFETIQRTWDAIDKIGKEVFGLSYYPPQIEVISSEQMLDAYSTVAMPVLYEHWSFGKSFIKNQQSYAQGQMGLAYEVVINTDPTLAYLMEDNTMTMQALVMAHAVCLDKDTQYLTRNGWRYISKYSGEEIAQYNEDGTISWVLPSRYIVNNTKQFMELRARGIHQLLTENHTVIYRDPDSNKLRRISAGALRDRHVSKSRGFNGKFITHFQLPETEGLGLPDAELKLQIAIKADGSRHGQKYRFHLKKERKIRRLIELLGALNISYNRTPTYGGREAVSFIYPEINKVFDYEWLMSLNSGQRAIAADEVLLWDGHVGTRVFSTTLQQSAEVIQTLWASLGYGTSIGENTAKEKTCYVVKRGSYSERTISGGRNPKSEIKNVPAVDGKAYCFTVPSGMFVARRSRNIFVTGNCGHGSFFKNNYLFVEWTDAASILDYLQFAKDYIRSCEEKYGPIAVEHMLDACHSIQYFSMDKYKRKPKENKAKQEARKQKWAKHAEETFDLVTHVTAPLSEKSQKVIEREENLLYFIEKNCLGLKPWQKEICRIVRKISQYFYPQMQTQVMNEGWATFWHYTILNHMWEQGQITDGSYLEFIRDHTAVVSQQTFTSDYYSGINPYAIGFAMMQDIKRICTNPTDEDRKWFPELVGADWLSTMKEIVVNYRDESFFLQFLSPKIIRDFRLCSILQEEDTWHYTISGTHSDEDILKIRSAISKQYSITHKIPQISAFQEEDGTLCLEYLALNGTILSYDDAKKTIDYVSYLWGGDVEIRYIDMDGSPVDRVK